MKAKDRPRFDIDAVRDLAGDKVFARGAAYHRDGQVAILSIERERVLAQVAGTDDYRTVLTGRGGTIDGECSCRAFSDWGLCKHMVATALAANSLGADAEADGALARIRSHLKERGVDVLVEMIVGMAERDPALFRRLDLAATTVNGDEKTLEARLRKAIDGATRTGGLSIIARRRAGPRALARRSMRSPIWRRLGMPASCSSSPSERSTGSSGRSRTSTIQMGTAPSCCIAPATSISPQPAQPAPNQCSSPASSSTARWTASTRRLLVPQRFMPTYSARKGSLNIAVSPARLGRSCLRAQAKSERTKNRPRAMTS